MVWEMTSFRKPAKRRSSKSRAFEATAQTELPNRYQCLEDIAQIDDDSWGESCRKSPLVSYGDNRLTGVKSYQTKLTPSSGSKSSLVSPNCGVMVRSEEEEKGQ